MIVIKSYAFSANNTILTATVEFDKDGEVYPFTPQVQVSQVLNMTQQQIIDWVKAQVTSRRGQMEQQAIDALLNPIMNQDLEA